MFFKLDLNRDSDGRSLVLVSNVFQSLAASKENLCFPQLFVYEEDANCFYYVCRMSESCY